MLLSFAYHEKLGHQKENNIIILKIASGVTMGAHVVLRPPRDAWHGAPVTRATRSLAAQTTHRLDQNLRPGSGALLGPHRPTPVSFIMIVI